MPVKRRKPKNKHIGPPAWQIRFLKTGELPPEPGQHDDDPNIFEWLQWKYPDSRPEVRRVWEIVKAEILPAWIERHPGSRPFGFWLDADLERRKGGIELSDGRVIGKNVVYGIRDSIPENQRQWLEDHGHLTPEEK